MARYRNGGKGKYILLVLLIALTAFSIFFARIYTDGFTKPFQFFYAEYNGNKILRESKLDISKNTDITINCKDTFSFLNFGGKQTTGFTVFITPNTNLDTSNNFTFTIDGEEIRFNQLADVTKGFKLTLYDTYFVLRVEKDMNEIIQAVYPNAEIELPDKDFSNDYYFTICINSNDTMHFVYIDFKII